MVDEDSPLTSEEIQKLLEPLDDISHPCYPWAKRVKCLKCGFLNSPFYFGDKPLNRKVMQPCVNCREEITFIPAEVDPGPSDEHVDSLV